MTTPSSLTKPSYIKHLIECNCILPQFASYRPPVFHKFVVFSVVENDGEKFIPSYAQCPHCGAIHHVVEVFTSKILPRETHALIPKIEDFKASLDDRFIKILETYHCDLHSWQELQFILDNELWGKTVILTKDEDGTGKFLLVLGHSLCKVDSFTTNEEE